MMSKSMKAVTLNMMNASMDREASINTTHTAGSMITSSQRSLEYVSPFLLCLV
jgi:hypothetical protein